MTATLAACVVSLVLASSAGAAPVFRLTGLTGRVVVTYQGEAWEAGPGAEVPIALPSGASVEVLSGRATFEGCGLRLQTTDGDSFNYGSIEEDGCSAGFTLAGVGEWTLLELSVADGDLTLGDGDAVSLRPLLGARGELGVLAGDPLLVRWGEERRLGPGQLIVVTLAKEPRPAVLAAEDLRSAPAPVARPSPPAVPAASTARAQPAEAAPPGAPARAERFPRELVQVGLAAIACALLLELALLRRRRRLLVFSKRPGRWYLGPPPLL